jgi:hypothetical protein
MGPCGCTTGFIGPKPEQGPGTWRSITGASLDTNHFNSVSGELAALALAVWVGGRHYITARAEVSLR